MLVKPGPRQSGPQLKTTLYVQMNTLPARAIRCTVLLLLCGIASCEHPQPPGEAAPPALQVGDVAHKVIEAADDDGDIRLSIKVRVDNPSVDDVEASVEVQAVDAEGFEVTDFSVHGRIRAGESRDLSDWLYLQQAAFETISKYKVERSSAWVVRGLPETAAPILFGEVAHKVVETVDEYGDLSVAFKVRVTNRGAQDKTVRVTIRAFDGDGFVVFDATLNGVVGAEQAENLTDTVFLQQSAYKSIASWQVIPN